MFTASLNIVLFTLPSNVGYIADFMANSAQFLDHPVPSYQAQSHFDHPAYYNPHNPPPEGFRAARRNRTDMMMGRGAVQQQKTIDVQRQQVDQVFMALPSHDELPETSPGEMIKTKLFVHQLKAITFLQQREQESSAVKAALAKKEEVEVVDVDAELNEEEKKKQIKKMKRKAEKDAKKRGVNSLWEPEFDGKKIKGWRHMVTEETVRAKEKPIEARGAILADEVRMRRSRRVGSCRLTFHAETDGSRKDSFDRQSDCFYFAICPQVRACICQER
jgi:SWI/SNF-related matrix-associated actin-dependent regulator of chromatin subfamily A3